MPYVIKSKIGENAYFKGITKDRFKSIEYCYNIYVAHTFNSISEAQKTKEKYFVLRRNTQIKHINQKQGNGQ